MAQPRPPLKDSLEGGRGAVAVLDVCCMDDETDQQADRGDDNVALAALDPRVKPEDMPSCRRRSPGCRRFRWIVRHKPLSRRA